MSGKAEEPRTLKEFAWQKLDDIAKAYQERNPTVTIEQAHAELALESDAYAEIHHLGTFDENLCSCPLDRLMSKAMADAAQDVKMAIVEAAARADCWQGDSLSD